MKSEWIWQIRTHLLMYFSLFLLLVCDVKGQQCMDSLPPFIPASPLLFCTENSKYGCCTVDDDKRLSQMYNSIRQSVLRDGGRFNDNCLQNFKSFLCARCSPHSAEMFQGSITRFGSPLIPGLCNDFCKTFFRNCANRIDFYTAVLTLYKTVPLETTKKLNLLTKWANSTRFCEAVSLPTNRNQFCLPNVDQPFGERTRFRSNKPNAVQCVCFEPYNVDLTNPVAVTHGADGTDRLFIAEQNGMVKVMFSNGTMFSDSFLNIQNKVFHDGDGFSLLGLLGLALHPNFRKNNKLYVFYTLRKNRSSLYVRVEEYRASVEHSSWVDPSSNRLILEFKKETNTKAGGPLLFGEDGYLYIFTGDDGGIGDTMETSQDLFMLSGKVLRIDVDRTDFIRGKEYSVPSDNPFAGREYLGLPEIYAWGMRNPRGCSSERSDSSDKSGARIFCGDVGKDTFEEVNIIKRNGNYGWNIKQGTADFCPECLRGSPDTNFTEPIFEYRHTLGKSVIGGYVYRGCLNPSLYDQYIFGDFQQGIIRLKELKTGWKGERLEPCSPSICKSHLTNQIQSYIHSFGEDEHGELYVLTTSAPDLKSPTGRIYKIVDPARRGNPATCKSARPVDGKSAVTRDDYALKPVSVEESNQETSRRTLLTTSGQQRSSSQRVQNQRRRNERPRTSILSGISRRNQVQNVETINITDNSQLTNLVESVLKRPDVHSALNDIQNARTPVSQSDTPTRQRQSSRGTTQVTNNSDVPSAVSSILRAAGLQPIEAQGRTGNSGSDQPQNTDVRQSAGLPQYTAQRLGIGLQGIGAGPVVPQNTNAQLGTLSSQTAVQGPLFLSQQAAAGLDFSQPRNTAAGIGTIIPQETVVKLGTILSQNSGAGQQNVQKKASGLRVILPQNTGRGLGTSLPKNTALKLGNLLSQKAAVGERNLAQKLTAANLGALLPQQTATRLGTLIKQNTSVATLPRSKIQAIGNKAISVNKGSNLTLIKLRKR